MAESRQVELRCTFSHHVYCGAVVLALLTGSGLDEEDVSLSVAVHGSIRVDGRWSHDDRLLHAFDALPASDHLSTPEGTKTDVFCFLHAPQRRIPKEQLSCLSTGGLFVQADLPTPLLPSFKGLHGQISYHIVLTAQLGSSSKEQRLFFPFRVSGRGYELPSFLFQETEVCCFPRDSLPPDHCFLRPDEISFIDEIKASITTYSVRDVQHVCNVSFSSPVFQEDLLLLIFDFRECEQSCRLVRVKLLLEEVRKDGEVLQVGECVI